MTVEARVISGRYRGLMSALTQLELVATRLRDRAAVHGGIDDPTGYHGEARRVLDSVATQMDKTIESLMTEFGSSDESWL